MGYRLLTAWWEDSASARFEASLDDVDPTQLILMRVSADALPYSNTSSEFHRSEGTIEIGAIRYRTVKKRIINDSIEFLCIPDGAANRLRSAKDDFFQLVNDLQKPGHPKFPGPSDKTNSIVHNIIWYDNHRFPNLHYFAARLVPADSFIRTDLSAGHSRISLQPPRQDNALS
jgi:hypothetical protein